MVCCCGRCVCVGVCALCVPQSVSERVCLHACLCACLYMVPRCAYICVCIYMAVCVTFESSRPFLSPAAACFSFAPCLFACLPFFCLILLLSYAALPIWPLGCRYSAPALPWSGGRGSGCLDGHRANGGGHFDRHDHHDVLSVAHDRHLLGRDVRVRTTYLVPGTVGEATAVEQ